MLQLHYFPGNASMTPHILLEKLGVPFSRSAVQRVLATEKLPAPYV